MNDQGYIQPERKAFDRGDSGPNPVQAAPGPRAKPMNHAWADQIKLLALRPTYITAPRGQSTFEVIGSSVCIDMHHPVLTVLGRDLGYKFMAAEAWWILSGRNDVASIEPYSKAIANFSDDSKTFFGAYGPKIRDQLLHVTDSLIRDPASRQSVLNIWRENPPDTKDTPCTLSLQFLIRDSRLHCIATMRSSDIWLGLPYDAFNFTMVATWVLLCLRQSELFNDLTIGTLTVNMGSSHLYERNAGKVLECMAMNFMPWQSKNLLQVLNKFNIKEPGDLVVWLHWLKDEEDGVRSVFKADVP